MKFILCILLICFFFSCSDELEKKDTGGGSVVTWFHTRSAFNISQVGNCKMLIFNGTTGNYIKTVDMTSDEMNFSLLFNPESYIFAFIANDNRFTMEEDAEWKRLNYFNQTQNAAGNIIPPFLNIKVKDVYKSKPTSSIYFDTITNVSLKKRGIDTLYIDMAPVQAKFSFKVTCDDAWISLSATIYTPMASYLYDKAPEDKLQLSTSGVFGEDGGYETRSVSVDNADFTIESSIEGEPNAYSYETYLFENLAGTIESNLTWQDFITNGDIISSSYKTNFRQQPTYIEFVIKKEGKSSQKKTQRLYIGGTENDVLNVTDYNVRRGIHYHYDINCTNAFSSSTRENGNDDISFVITGSTVEPL